MFVNGHPPYHGPGRPKGSQNTRTVEAKQLAQWLVSDKTYQRNLQKHVQAGETGGMEPMLWAYAYGKPKEQIESNGHLEKLSDRELAELETLLKRVA